MRILYCFKLLFFKHLEKVIACAATGLFAVSMVHSISLISFDEKSDTNDLPSSLSINEFMAEANSREIEKVTSVSKTKMLSDEKKKKEKISNAAEKVSTTFFAASVTTKASNTYSEKTKSKKNETRNITKDKNKKSDSKEIKSENEKKTNTKKKTHTYKKTGNKIKDRLNSVKLKPKQFLKGKEEKILKKHLNKIIDDDMSNYEKAKACYDYIINNTYYAYGGWGNAIESVLENGYGTCTEYSYVYMAMMRYLGFDAKTVDGSTAMAAGGYGYHMWTEVNLNGNTYVFDPQVEDDMSNGKINYYRFCKTYSEVSGSYIK